jgi:hypothetical protein
MPERPATMRRRIGNTIYHVNVHFNPKAKETAEQKMVRLIRNDVAGKVVNF